MRKVYLTVADAPRFLEALGQGSAFVSTPLQFQLGEFVTLAVRLNGVARILDLPVVIIGRRVGHKRAAALSDGIQVRLRDADHPIAELVRNLADGSVVDLAFAMKSHSVVPVETTFAYNDELVRVVDKLLAFEDATVNVNQNVEVGDQMRLSIRCTDLLTLPPFIVVARGLILRDGIRRVRIRLSSEADRVVLRSAKGRRGGRIRRLA